MGRTLSSVTCLLLHHRDDRYYAKWIKGVLEQEGATCHLLYDVVGADIHTDTFSRADEADCVISLITQKLSDDEKERTLHRKVCFYLRGKKYMAVKLNTGESNNNSPAWGFLEGCHVLDHHQMNQKEFQECLVAEVKAVARPQRLESHSLLPSDADEPSAGARPNYKPTGFVDRDSTEEPLVKASNKNIRQRISKDFVSWAHLAHSAGTPSTIVMGLIAAAIAFTSNDVNTTPNSKVTEDEDPGKTIRLNGNEGGVAISCNDNQLSIEENDREETSAAAMVQSNSISLMTNVTTPQEFQVKVDKDQLPEASGYNPLALFGASRANSISVKLNATDHSIPAYREDHDQLALTRFSDKRRSLTDAARKSETSDDGTNSMVPFMLSQTEGHTDLNQHLFAGLFSKLAFKNVDGQRISVAEKTIHGNRPPIQFLRSPFLWPVLSVEKLSMGYKITSPWTSKTLTEVLCSENKNMQLSDHSSLAYLDNLRSFFLRVVYHIAIALDFLHSRQVFHGNVTPNCILIDDYGNARLGDYGQHRALLRPKVVQEACLLGSEISGEYDGSRTDTFMFGVIVCLVLKCTNDRQELPDVENIVGDERYVDTKLWPLGSEPTRCLCKISLDCVRKSNAIPTVVTELKVLLANYRLPVVNFPNEHDRCVYCMIGTPNQSLQVRPSYCPEKCHFLQICPSCLPSICSDRYLCPEHNTRIHPPIGGDYSCALIISGRDVDDNDAQNTYYNDAHEMELAVSHPYVMAIPPKNIYRISPWDNPNAADINRVLASVARHDPDFFLLYYSGHIKKEGERSSFDVSSEQGDTLDMATLQKSLLSLVKTCSKMLVAIDCCYAANFCSILQPEPYTDDSHINFHTFWPSCGRNEESNLPPCEENSLFTKCFLAGLKGGRQCPNATRQCTICERFRNVTEARHCVSMKALEDFVNLHMKSRPLEGRDDCQNPVVTESRRESDPVIAYYRPEPLYRFHYEPPAGQGFRSRVCELDTLRYGNGIIDVLESLWNQLRREHLPNKLDHLTLQILCHNSDGSFHEASEIKDITQAVFENPDSLCVGIRTDGSKLNTNRAVACLCDEQRAKDSVRRLLDGDKNQIHSKERAVVKFDLKEISQSWKPAVYDVFEKTLQDCWNSLLSLRQHSPGNKSCFLRVEIREKLSMISLHVMKEPKS